MIISTIQNSLTTVIIVITHFHVCISMLLILFSLSVSRSEKAECNVPCPYIVTVNVYYCDYIISLLDILWSPFSSVDHEFLHIPINYENSYPHIEKEIIKTNTFVTRDFHGQASSLKCNATLFAFSEKHSSSKIRL